MKKNNKNIWMVINFRNRYTENSSKNIDIYKKNNLLKQTLFAMNDCLKSRITYYHFLFFSKKIKLNFNFLFEVLKIKYVFCNCSASVYHTV